MSAVNQPADASSALKRALRAFRDIKARLDRTEQMLPGTPIGPLLHRRLRSPMLRGHVFESIWTLGSSNVDAPGLLAPPSTQLDLILAAVEESYGPGRLTLQNVTFLDPIVISSDHPREVQVTLEEPVDSHVSIGVHSRVGERWIVHATATALVGDAPDSTTDPIALDTMAPTEAPREGWVIGEGWARCRFPPPESGTPIESTIALRFDTALALLSTRSAPPDPTMVLVPLAIAEVQLFTSAATPVTLLAFPRGTDADGDGFVGDLHLLDDDGAPVASLLGVATQWQQRRLVEARTLPAQGFENHDRLHWPSLAEFTHAVAHIDGEQTSVDRSTAVREPASAAAGEPIPIAQRTKSIPVSSAQRRLLFLESLQPGAAIHNLPVTVRLTGDIDVDALESAFTEVVRRHEVLRTDYDLVDGEFVQRIRDPQPLRVHRDDLRQQSPAEWDARLRSEATAPFDLARGPKVRVHLFAVGERDHILMATFHHVAADGWSVSRAIHELSELYTSAVGGTPATLTPLPIQYSDYAYWQRRQLETPELADQVSYWADRLAGELPPLDLPTDRPWPATRSLRGEAAPFEIAPALMEAVASTSRKAGVTPFMTMLAAWSAVLARYTGQHDVVVGTAMANRGRAETQALVGLFVNTLAIRVSVDPGASFGDLVSHVKAVALGAYAHQDVPFDRVVEAIRPPRDLSRPPVFQTMFLLNNVGIAAPKLADTSAEFVRVVTGAFDLDLSLELVDTGGVTTGEMRFNTDVFDRGTIERLVEHWLVLLAAALAEPARPVGGLALLPAAERELVVAGWNATEAAVRDGVRVDELVSVQAARTPEVVAVVAGDESVTYGELEDRANRLAHQLVAVGVVPGDLVGVGVDRSVEMVVALLAVLKCGAAYVPLDPAFPADRLALMVADTALSVVITSAGALTDRFDTSALTVIDVVDDAATIAANPSTPVTVTGGELTYVIYTSGSTGVPKGVQVTHRNVVNFLTSMQLTPGFSASDVLVAVTTLSFDISVLEIFLPLVSGGRLVVATRDQAGDGTALAALIDSSDATVVQATPTTWTMLLESGWTGNDTLKVLCGGEALPRHLADQLVAGCGDVWNMFGPTETTIWSTLHHLSADEEGPVSIGRPIANTVCRILDRGGELCPIGVAGELHIGGAGVTAGYLNRPELTAERFIADRYGADGRLYRTGDLARWRPDATIEFLGRLDHQVKVRGYRIELGEIETALRHHHSINDAVVVARGADATATLAAYLIATDPTHPPTIAELRAHLHDRLPHYMIPTAFIYLDAFPLTPNRKIDRNALPMPDVSAVVAVEGVAPRTELEAEVLAIWVAVLGVATMGVHDNFFELGGHSLMATQLVSRLRAQLDVELPVRVVFEAPTVAEMTALIDAMVGSEAGSRPPIERVARDGVLPLSFAQERMWFLDQLVPDAAVYNIPVAIRVRGRMDIAAMGRAVAALVGRHEALRTRVVADDEGIPHQVIGDDQPGVFGFEVVDLRDRQGEDVEAVALDYFRGLTHRKVDLAVGPVFQCAVVQVGDEDQFLFTVIHHIAADQWSLGVIGNELAALYAAEVTGVDAELPALELQYPDFAVWQRELLNGEELEAQLDYWREQLDGLTQVTLPLDRPRPPIEQYAGTTITSPLPEGLVDRMERFARAEGVTVFTVTLASFHALLGRYGDQHDVSVGVPMAYRHGVDIETIVGNFVNTLVLRGDLSGEPDFRQLVHRTQAVVLDGEAHQDLPFEVLVNELTEGRDLSRSALVQVLFNFHQRTHRTPVLHDLSLEPVFVDRESAQFDLSVLVITGEEIVEPQLVIDFNTDVFDRGTIERLVEHWLVLLAAALAEPARPVGGLALLPAAERELVVAGWNATEAAVRDGVRVDELVSVQAARTPEVVAVVAGDESVTYGELEDRANRLAHQLVAVGVVPGDLVGVGVDRSVEMVVALLAVLKCGAAYVPLDPAFPADRLALMVADTALSVVITSAGALTDRFDTSALTVIDVVDDAATIAANPSTPVTVTGGELTYVIYTSGSTGVPKGVQVTHRNVVNFLTSMQLTPGFSASDVLVAVTTLSFDISVLEIFLPLVSGGRLVVATRDQAGDGTALAALIDSSDATVVQATPTTWTMLLESGWTGNDTLKVLCGGEALPRHLADQLVAGCGDVWNMFGPTETTIWSTLHHLSADEEGPVSIGRPIANTVCRILDRGGELCPIGVAGELHIGGAGVTAGYLNRPELTAERFIADRYGADGRLYRTGDLARWRPDATIEFLGRLDHQVKVRGYRIELGEIETALRHHHSINDAVVVARGADATATLAAYLIATDPTHPPTIAELRAHLHDRLPHYMIPTAFIYLDAFPLTPNRKIDRNALPADDGAQRAARIEYVEPASDVERAVADVFATVFSAERVGANDNFFELGGHSLLATSLLARLGATFGVKVGLREFFLDPTVRGAAAALTDDPTTRSRVERIAQLQIQLASMSPEQVAELLVAKRSAQGVT